MKAAPYFLFLFISVLFSVKTYSQLSVGAHYSTFDVPAGSFSISGFGLDLEYRRNKMSSCLTANFFSKQLSTDSTQTGGMPGSIQYARYYEKYNILLLSFVVKDYFIGSNKLEDKFSAYAGGGFGCAQNIISTDYNKSANIPDQKENVGTFTFDFLAGADFKVISNNRELCKFFVQAKANLGLKFIIDGYYDTAAPFITNLQAGVLFPLKKYQKDADELY
jgi:hypothetical protein